MRAARVEPSYLSPAIADAVRSTARPNPTDRRPPKARPPFKDVLCAVDGSRGSAEAVHQAIALCGSAAPLRLVAISHELSSGRHAQVDLSERRALEALGEAAEAARRAGVEASTELLHGAPTSDLLLAEAAEHDLLVVTEESGRVLGGLIYRRPSATYVVLEWIVVGRHRRGRHIGSVLLGDFLERLKVQGVKAVSTGFFRPGFFAQFGFGLDPRYAGIVKILAESPSGEFPAPSVGSVSAPMSIEEGRSA